VALQCFVKSISQPNNFTWGVFVRYPSGRWEAIKLMDSKVDKVDDDLMGEHCEGED
jgi:hypothetical protein